MLNSLHQAHMPNLVMIFGPPAAGKAAVGFELARLTRYRFFHNHLTNDAAVALFNWGTPTFSRMVDMMRTALLTEAANDPSIPGVIFTFAWALDLAEDTALVRKYTQPYRDTGAKVMFVELTASLSTRIEREGTPFRLALKPAHRDVAAARARLVEFDQRHVWNTSGKLPVDDLHLILNTEALSPVEAAQRIVAEWDL